MVAESELQDLYRRTDTEERNWRLYWTVGVLFGAIAFMLLAMRQARTARTALRLSGERYRFLFENNPMAMWVCDPETLNFLMVNESAIAIYGYSRNEFLGMTLLDIRPAEHRALFQDHIRGAGPGYIEPGVWTHRKKDGTLISVEVTSYHVALEGKLRRLVAACDVTEREHARLLECDRRLVLEMIAENRPLREILDALNRMIEHQSPGLTCVALLRGETNDSGAHTCWCSAIVSSAGELLGHFEIRHSEPREPTTREIEFVSLADRVGVIAIEQRQLNDRLAYQAHHDPLTALPNRFLLEDRLRQAIANARRGGKMAALVYIDLDRFKLINDVLGHGVGDALLQEVARRFAACLRETDTISRSGGDEFTVVLADLMDTQNAMQIARKLLDAVHAPFEIQGNELFVTASMGISLYPQDGIEASPLQRKADAAMYRAKNLGKNGIQFFTAEMADSEDRLEMESHLHRALARGEFKLHYQPQFELTGGRLTGMEALLRWYHPKFGVVPPAKFIPIAEESGLIVAIGAWVLREACRQNREWQRLGDSHFRVSVNVSAVQFARQDFVATVAAALAESGLEPCFLELELTESLVMRDINESARQMTELRALGVRISIDDFGTGYSSLSYLQKLPVDFVKIDQSFIHDIEEGANLPRLVQAVVMLAHGLGMQVTAEGVETEHQLGILRRLGCDQAQGFLLGRPAAQDHASLLGLARINPIDRIPAPSRRAAVRELEPAMVRELA